MMWRLDHKSSANRASMILAGLACIAALNAQSEAVRDRHDSRASAQAARPRAELRSRRAHPHARTVRAGASETVHAGRRELANHSRLPVGGAIHPPRPAALTALGEAHGVGGGRVQQHAIARDLDGGQVHVVRYANSLSGTVEHPIGPGLTSRTFVSGGHVLYARVYQRHVWNQFGRAFTYETFLPAVRYPEVFYAWTLAAWPHPISYAWAWQTQPWYLSYGSRFTPYPVYASPDLWMTDYILAESMQTAYEAQAAAPTSQAAQPGAAAVSAADSGVPTPPPAAVGDAVTAPQPNDAPPVPPSSATPSAPAALPPAITPQVKAQLDAQIKVQLQEQQAAAVIPATLTTQSTPPALKPNHVFFQVVYPIDVPTAHGHCSLGANDYIKRTGPMRNDDWMIPVVVELSRPSDCPEGLQTSIGLNDLNAMENEQEAQVVEAMQAASKSMGPNGPPSPAAHPTFIANGDAVPDPMALEAIRQTE